MTHRKLWLAAALITSVASAQPADAPAAAPPVTLHEIALFYSGTAGPLPAPPALSSRPAERALDLAPPDALAERPLPESTAGAGSGTERAETGGPRTEQQNAAERERPRTPVQAFIFVSAPADSALEVTARYPGGTPLAWTPAAQVVTDEPLLAWTGTVSARVRLPRVDRDHFWATLRRLSPGAFSTGAAGSGERFLHHQGLIEVSPPFTVSRQGVSPSQVVVRAAGMERLLWLSVDGRVRRVRIPAGDSELAVDLGASGGMELPAFRRELERALEDRGLTTAEARAALATWQTLLMSRDAHAIMLMPRNLLDRTLPLTASPAPAELVRVALLVQDL